MHAPNEMDPANEMDAANEMDPGAQARAKEEYQWPWQALLML